LCSSPRRFRSRFGNHSNHKARPILEFRGFVTVTVQIPIELNEQPKFVDWSTEVKDVVPANFPESFQIQRRFSNSYFPVQYKQGDDSILGLTLVGGDRITWSHN
jgi:hypothetical protein